MSAKENKALCDEMFPKTWNTGDLSQVENYVSADVVDHFDNSQGIEAFKGVIRHFRGAFPDFQFTLEDSVAEDDKVVHRWRMTGTQEGELMGFPPTGKRLTWTGITIFRLENGKVVERWANVDLLGILQQMGIVPAGPGG